MPAGRAWASTPRQSITAECARRGTDAVVDGCLRLLHGTAADPALLLALAGPAAHPFLDGGQRDDVYWLRVWALRGLLWVDEHPQGAAVAEAVAAALDDEAWRVREMAVRVAVRHHLSDLTAAVAELRVDPVTRVAAAAVRALPRLAADLGRDEPLP